MDRLLFLNKNMKDHPEFKEMSKVLTSQAEEEQHMIAPVPVELSDWGVSSAGTSELSLSQASTSTNTSNSQSLTHGSDGTPAMPELPTMGGLGEDLSLKTE